MYNPLAILAVTVPAYWLYPDKSVDDGIVLLALSQEMIERREQPRQLGIVANESALQDQMQSMVEQAFPGAQTQWTHLWLPREMKTYLKNAGYTHIEGLDER